MRRGVALLLAFAVCCSSAFAAVKAEQSKEARKTVVTVNLSDQWLTSITAFLSGGTVQVKAARRQIPGGSWTRAALQTGVSWVLDSVAKKALGKGTVLFPQLTVGAPFFYGDPANLPFVAQKIGVQLALLQPQNSGFYQRRLAEFETRLRSTLLSGRAQLAGKKILDPGGVYAQLWRATGCDVVAGSEAKSLLEGYKTGASCPWEGGYLVLDWTVGREMDKFGREEGVLTLTPDWGFDPLDHLHKMFLTLGALPPKGAVSAASEIKK